jgi:predicted transposase YbfD/YdcC
MNERIKELWENSTGATVPEDGYYSSASKYNIEKFAELIVQECADACYKHKDVESFGIYPVRVAMVTKACADNIKEHFGVEE